MPTEQFKHGASPHAEVREEHELPRDDGPRQERNEATHLRPLSPGEYEVWRKEAAVNTYGPIVWRFIESCFGAEALGRDFAAAVWTDSAYAEQPGLGDIGVLFGSTQQDRKRSPTAFGRSADMSQLIRNARQRGKRIGVLVHYRPLFSHLLDFAGTPLEIESVVDVERFADERLVRWKNLSLTRDFAPPSVAVHTALDPEEFDSPILVFVSAPLYVLVAAGITPTSTHHRCSITGELPLAQWTALDRVLTEMLRTAGGEVVEALTEFPETWHASPVAKREGERPVSTRDIEPARDAVRTDPEPKLPARPVDLSEFVGIRAAAREVGVDKVTIQRAIDSGKLNVYRLGDGREVISRLDCNRLWPTGPNPVGRPPKKP